MIDWWFYIILLPLSIAGWVLCFYWMRGAKGKEGDFWKVTIAGVIQLFIFGAILFSAIEMGEQAKSTHRSVQHMGEQLELSRKNMEQIEEQFTKDRFGLHPILA